MKIALVLIVMASVGCGSTSNDPKEPAETTAPLPTTPAASCDAKYKSWSSGPLLSDGCMACDVPCTPIQCRSDDSSSFETSSMKSITYVWHCVTYKGAKNRYVSLTFESDGRAASQCWKQTSEYVSSGICP